MDKKDSLNCNQGQERGGGEEKNRRWWDDMTAYMDTSWTRLAQDRCRWLLHGGGGLHSNMGEIASKARLSHDRSLAGGHMTERDST